MTSITPARLSMASGLVVGTLVFQYRRSGMSVGPTSRRRLPILDLTNESPTRRAGVSKATPSYAVNPNVLENTKSRVRSRTAAIVHVRDSRPETRETRRFSVSSGGIPEIPKTAVGAGKK